MARSQPACGSCSPPEPLARSRSCECRSCASAAVVARSGRAISPRAASVFVATAAVVADRRMVLGALGVAVLAAAQGVWVRRPPMPAKQIGLRQMGMGLALVAVTAVGVLW